MITKEEAADIRTRHDQVRAWLTAHKTNSYRREELSAEGIVPPTNQETSALEVYEWMTNPPDRYFIYISREKRIATTWTGEKLGAVSFGSKYRSNLGDWRVPITIVGTNGRLYHGTFFESSGDYARIKRAKHSTGLLKCA